MGHPTNKHCFNPMDTQSKCFRKTFCQSLFFPWHLIKAYTRVDEENVPSATLLTIFLSWRTASTSRKQHRQAKAPEGADVNDINQKDCWPPCVRERSERPHFRHHLDKDGLFMQPPQSCICNSYPCEKLEWTNSILLSSSNLNSWKWNSKKVNSEFLEFWSS